MKSVTIIWCDWGDQDTALCQKMWQDLPSSVSVNLVHITEWNHTVERVMEMAIQAEGDTLLFCGHGTPHGLLVPKNFGEYVLHQYNVKDIKAKTVLGVTCYAKEFAENVGLHGLFSSMFISNIDEATTIGIDNTSSSEIEQSNTSFYFTINKILSGLLSLDEALKEIQKLGWKDAVSSFNAAGFEIL